MEAESAHRNRWQNHARERHVRREETPATRLDVVRAGDTEWPAAWPDLGVAPGASQPSLGPPLQFPDASPSVRFVYACLRLSDGATARELALCSGLPPRTVRYAINWLIRRGLARRITLLGDARKSILILREPVPVPEPPPPAATRFTAPTPVWIAQTC